MKNKIGKMSGIYIIINTANSKCYIGSSSNIKRRWNEHKRLLRGDKHSNPYLQNSWNKYGEESFNFNILAKVNEKLIKREQFFINGIEPEYNLVKNVRKTPVQKGSGCREETVEKISNSRKGKLTGENNPMYNKSREFSKEWRDKISSALSNKRKGENNPFYNKEHSKKAKEKISKKSKGEENGNSKLTKQQVIEIKNRLSNNEKLKDICKDYNVTGTAIRRIKKGKAWSHIEL